MARPLAELRADADMKAVTRCHWRQSGSEEVGRRSRHAQFAAEQINAAKRSRVRNEIDSFRVCSLGADSITV